MVILEFKNNKFNKTFKIAKIKIQTTFYKIKIKLIVYQNVIKF